MKIYDLEQLHRFLVDLEASLVNHGVELDPSGITIKKGDQRVKVEQVAPRRDPDDWHIEVTFL